MTLWIAVGLILSLFDSYVSFRRIKTYGSFAEMNILVRQLCSDFNTTIGTGVGLLYNLALLGLMVYMKWDKALIFLCGAKFGLCLMQLKSLQMESFVEKVLAKAKQKREQKVS